MDELDAERHSGGRDSATVRSILGTVPGLIAVYLFGSSATGEQRHESDIDLAVLAARPIDPLQRFDLQEQLAAALGRSVDLVDLRTASPVMAIQVIAKGRLLIDENPASRGAFEDLVYGSYARLNEERRDILARIAAEGTVYGR